MTAYSLVDGVTMDRRRSASGPQGLTNANASGPQGLANASGPQGLSTANALQKLKSDLRDVLDDLKAGVGDEGRRRRLQSEASVADENVGDVDEKDAEDHVTEVSTGNKSPLRISTAIPFDYWSVALLALSVVLLLVSQVNRFVRVDFSESICLRFMVLIMTPSIITPSFLLA